MFKQDLLKGKRILVTGGGTGLGREMATRFAELDADLYLCDRRQDVLEATAREIAARYGVRTCRLNGLLRVDLAKTRRIPF
jgi:short-subunit dehydrogenase